MEHRRTGGVLRPAIATALLLLGLASLGMWRVLSGSEDLPFADSASPPALAQVTRNHTYSLAVPGGVRAMLAHGVPTAGPSGAQISLQCHWGSSAASDQAVTVSAESTSTKAENTVGHFVAPVSGRINVDCDGWGAMFIPDSDDRGVDIAGWALLIAVLALTIGGALAVSESRLAWERSRAARAAYDEEHEQFDGSVQFEGSDGDDVFDGAAEFDGGSGGTGRREHDGGEGPPALLASGEDDQVE